MLNAPELHRDRPRILAIDDDSAIRSTLKIALAEDFDIHPVDSVRSALEVLSHCAFDAVLLDMNLPEISGMEFLKMLRQRRPDLPVVMLTANDEPRAIVEAIRAGASDYVVKNSSNLDAELRFQLSQAIEVQRVRGKNRRLEAKLTEHSRRYEMVGEAPEIIKLQSLIASLKGQRPSVLIHGESGTGKELVARALNAQEADGTARPFIAVNCAAIPENLAESELFGHEKGAFTGAIQKQIGKFVAADGGDIFLDEIGELSPAIQAKLLRAIQERVVTPVGSVKPISIDVRIIAATHRNLQREVQSGRFREDLYYRLNVITLEVPPLRHRRADIPMLAVHLLKTFGKGQFHISANAMKILLEHPWPGNVRELGNCLERAYFNALAQGSSTIDAKHIVLCSPAGPSLKLIQVPEEYLAKRAEELSPEHYRSFISWAEKVYFGAAFEATHHNRTTLRERLQVSRDFIYRKLKSLGLSQAESSAMEGLT